MSWSAMLEAPVALYVTVQVSDKLRDMLLNPDSENAELFRSSERAELLFCIFEHICLGGAINQFEVTQVFTVH